MLKIQNGSDVLYACNSLVIIPDEVTSYLNIAAIIKPAPQTNSFAKTGQPVQTSQKPTIDRLWLSAHYRQTPCLSDHQLFDQACEVCRDMRRTNSIHNLFWFLGHILRYSFISWLVSMGYLHTIDIHHAYQIISSSICILCGLYIKTRDHMFFWCPFTTSV